LPIRGELLGPVATTVALRTDERIPRGARVVARLWSDDLDIEACASADRWTDLESHMRGLRCCGRRSERRELRVLDRQEHGSLAAFFPWVGPVPEAPEEKVDALRSDFGLCDEDAELLKELLSD
jgi:hypothetical protein